MNDCTINVLLWQNRYTITVFPLRAETPRCSHILTTEHKKTGILSLNVKKLISLHLVWNKIQKLQWGSLFFITSVMLVGIWSESLPKHGSTIIKSFLGIVLSTLILFLKIILYICQWSHVDFKSTVLKWSFENHQVMQSHLDSKQYRS